MDSIVEMSHTSLPISAAQDIAGRWQNLTVQWADARNLIEDLMRYCNHIETSLRQENIQLREKVSTLELDLEDAKATRRKFQLDLRKAQEEYNALIFEHQEHNEKLVNTNIRLQNNSPYILALIDGDGVLFKDEYIRDGLDGGKRAAKDFHIALKEKCGIYKDDIRIEVKVITNLLGLARAVKREGIVTFETEFREFAQGFTQALSSFDFIDVGSGKERADSKIKEIARWHLQAFNCKHLLLGISHDSGYAPFLDEIYTGSEVGSRISLIEATPTHKHIVRTGINIINMADSIFRADKICEGPPNLNSDDSPQPKFATQSGNSTPSTALQPRGASPPPRIKLLIPPRAPSPSKKATATWNPGPHGLDPPVTYNQASIDSIKNRGDGKKPCNLYFLRNTCPRNIVDCTFDHRHTVTKEELGAIEFLARTNPCQYGQDCPNTDCVYGHNCPTVREGICVNASCKFTVAQHPPNTKFRNTHIPDN